MKVYFNSKMIPSFGVAGNFTGHLEQAGEAVDFVNVKTNEVSAPKGIFPTYLPKSNITAGVAPEFLHVFPFDSKQIIFPAGEEKIQIEPECAIIFNAIWDKTTLKKLEPLCFAASNDCSIRKAGAKKISQKKNWGPSSKGLSEMQIEMDGFVPGTKIYDYRIASFLIRDGQVYSYGEDSQLRDYSYFSDKLTSWLVDKFNNQKDEGPLENLYSYLEEAGFPQKIMVSIGATRYTKWGESNFLQEGDETVVILYPGNKYSPNYIKSVVADLQPSDDNSDFSILRQKMPSQ